MKLSQDNDIIEEEIKYIDEQAWNIINTKVLAAYDILQDQYRLMLSLVDGTI